MLFLVGVDPLRDFPDAGLARRALQNVSYKVVQSLELGELEAFADAVLPDAPGQPLPVVRAVAHLPRLDLGPDEAVAAGHGRILGPAGIAGPYGVFGPDGGLIGVYRDDGPRAKPEVILAS